MIAYYDTSAALKLLIVEPGTAPSRELWRITTAAVSSDLLYPEGRAAIAAAGRAGRCSVPRVRPRFEALVARFDLLATSKPLLSRAGDLAEVHALRGYDAVHLASAEASGCDTLVAADLDLLDAASEIGISVSDVRR